MLSRENRITACLLGGALGDAIGSHFEGSSGVTGFVLPTILRITDDTQLTLATCESIIDSGIVSPEAVADHFVRWFRQGRISGIGASTLKSLTELSAGGHWALVGATGERSAGNGAAMRIAPVAFFLDPDIDTDRKTIRDICRITHRNEEAYVGAMAVLRSIRYVVSGGELSAALIAYLIASLPDSNVRDRLIVIYDSSLTINQYVTRFGTTGYVADSVPLAILAAIGASDIMDSIKQLVQFGGDTDTIPSIFGQIFGACHGVESLPWDAINRIDAEGMIRKTGRDLSRISIAR